jgi:hypothetical protein
MLAAKPPQFVMLIAAFDTLGIAVLAGAALAILYLRRAGAAPPWWLAAMHVVFALAGLGSLLLALRGPPRGLEQGTGSFGTIAAVLIALAALAGGRLLAARIAKRRPVEILVGAHATLAIGGFVILAVYVFTG